MLDGAREEIRRRDEIGIENGDEFACGGLQSFLQRAGFEALAIVAVMVFDGEPQSAIALHQRRGKWGGVVGGIVQHLDLEQLAGILDAGDLVDEPLDDVPFVEDGQLNGDRRQLREASGRLAGGLLAVLEVGADHLITMHTSTSAAANGAVSSVESSSTWIWSNSRGYSTRVTSSMSRSMTYRSLKMGS